MKGSRLRLSALALSIAGLAVACAGPPRTTRIAVEDYQAMAVQMAESLAQSDALAERNAESEPWVVSVTKLTNLTSDVMSESEQWSIIEQIRTSLAMSGLWDRKHVKLVLPPERRAAVRAAAGLPDTLDNQPAVTHTMTATFRSATRADLNDRTELYFAEFEMIDLRDGRPTWTDTFEYKRVARGNLRD